MFSGDKHLRRLSEIDVNLVHSPLTRLERLEHMAEREPLEKQMCAKLEHGGDRKSKNFQVGKNFHLKSPILSEAEAEKIGMSGRSKRRASRFCKLLSVEERTCLKETAVERCNKDLFALADIGDIQKRTAVIDALSDAEKPAPSLYEAKYRAGIAQPTERDFDKEFERGANRVFDSLFDGKRGALERFLRRVGAEQPEFIDITTELVNRLTERGGES